MSTDTDTDTDEQPSLHPTTKPDQCPCCAGPLQRVKTRFGEHRQCASPRGCGRHWEPLPVRGPVPILTADELRRLRQGIEAEHAAGLREPISAPISTGFQTLPSPSSDSVVVRPTRRRV